MQRRYFPAQIEKGEFSFGVWFADLPGCVSAETRLRKPLKPDMKLWLFTPAE